MARNAAVSYYTPMPPFGQAHSLTFPRALCYHAQNKRLHDPTGRERAVLKATIKDIARAAGVSASTVSRALHNNPRISQDVRTRIQAIARSMDFHPNQMARSLVNRETRIVGAVFPDDLTKSLGNPFYPVLLQGLGHAAGQRHYHLLLITGSEAVSPAQASREAVDSGYVSGLIYLAAENAPTAQTDVPAVVIGRPPDNACPCVDNDNVQAGFAAARHLLDHGHTRIALAGYDERYIFTVDRRQGYEQALAQAGQKPAAVIPARLLHTPADGTAVHDIFGVKDRPTAAVCMDDATAVTLAGMLQGMDLSVPQDVSLVCFNDTQAARSHNPALTVFDPHPYELGVTAMNLMLDILGGTAPPNARLRVPFALIERDSVQEKEF